MISMKVANGPIFKKAILKASKNLGEVLPYTLTNCAFEGRAKLIRDLPKHIDRPAPATTRGVYYTKAKKNDPKPFSEVKFSPLAWKWMKYAVHGGTRTGSTLTAPVAADKNGFGNVVAGQRASKILGRGGYFRATIGGKDGIWERKGAGLRLMHVYKSSLKYEKRLPMSSIVYAEATRVFPIKFKENTKKALQRSAKL